MAFQSEYAKQHRRKYIREYMRQRRSRLRSLHRCSECGKEDKYTKMGYMCENCRARIDRNFKIRQMRKMGIWVK